MYKLGRGNKRKGIGGFWRVKWGLTRCAMENGVVQGGVVLTLRGNREVASLGLGTPDEVLDFAAFAYPRSSENADDYAMS